MMTKSTTLTIPANDADLYPVGKVIPFRITSDRTVNGTISKTVYLPDRNVIEVTFEFDEEIDIPTDDRKMTVSEEGQ